VAYVSFLLVLLVSFYLGARLQRRNRFATQTAKRETPMHSLHIYKPGLVPLAPQHASVAIVGCARDVAKFLPKMREVISRVRSLFGRSRVCIYENDSRDSTLSILQSWEKSGFSHVISERKTPGGRTGRLAHGRNILMRWALRAEDSPPSYVIVMDLDNVNTKLKKEAVKRCFTVTGNWGMLGANQTRRYYDLWALRTFDDWMPFDCWACAHAKGKQAQHYCVGSRFRSIAPTSPIIEVVSCFGGFALYKSEYMLGPHHPLYVGVGCEHVSFNRAIRLNGGAIAIAPFLLNS